MKQPRDKRGRFVKGVSYSPGTQFKKGSHWRESKPYWQRDWMFREYTANFRSAADIASEFGVTENAILYWLKKHGIPGRTASEVRARKRWGNKGSKNPMYGRRGSRCPSWKGGVTPERQALYSSPEWAEVSRAVRERDSWTCQRCGKKRGKMHIHHIVSFAVKEFRTELSNLILLCIPCHRWVHSKKNTEKSFVKEVK